MALEVAPVRDPAFDAAMVLSGARRGRVKPRRCRTASTGVALRPFDARDTGRLQPPRQAQCLMTQDGEFPFVPVGPVTSGSWFRPGSPRPRIWRLQAGAVDPGCGDDSASPNVRVPVNVRVLLAGIMGWMAGR